LAEVRVLIIKAVLMDVLIVILEAAEQNSKDLIPDFAHRSYQWIEETLAACCRRLQISVWKKEGNIKFV